MAVPIPARMPLPAAGLSERIIPMTRTGSGQDPQLRRSAQSYLTAPGSGLVDIGAKAGSGPGAMFASFGQNFMQTALAGRQARMMQEERIAQRAAEQEMLQRNQMMLNRAVATYTADPSEQNFAQLAAMSPQLAKTLKPEAPDYVKKLESKAAEMMLAGDPSLYQEIAAMKRPPGTTIDLGQSGEKQFNEFALENITSDIRSGQAAAETARALASVREQMAGLETGAFDRLTSQGKQLLAQAGFSGDLSTEQGRRVAANQKMMQIALQSLRSTYGGNPTEGERAALLQSFPRVESPTFWSEMNSLEATLASQAARGQAAATLLQKGVTPEGYGNYLSQSFGVDLSESGGGESEPTGGGTPPPANPRELNAIESPEPVVEPKDWKDPAAVDKWLGSKRQGAPTAAPLDPAAEVMGP